MGKDSALALGSRPIPGDRPLIIQNPSLSLLDAETASTSAGSHSKQGQRGPDHRGTGFNTRIRSSPVSGSCQVQAGCDTWELGDLQPLHILAAASLAIHQFFCLGHREKNRSTGCGRRETGSQK